MKALEETLGKMHKKIRIKRDEIEGTQDELLCHKHENELIEREIKNKKEQVENLKKNCKIKRRKHVIKKRSG